MRVTLKEFIHLNRKHLPRQGKLYLHIYHLLVASLSDVDPLQDSGQEVLRATVADEALRATVHLDAVLHGVLRATVVDAVLHGALRATVVDAVLRATVVDAVLHATVVDAVLHATVHLDAVLHGALHATVADAVHLDAVPL